VRAGRELAPDQVLGTLRGRVGDSGGTPAFLAAALQARGPHQPRDPDGLIGKVAQPLLVQKREPDNGVT
jgi:hypothetical protein